MCIRDSSPAFQRRWFILIRPAFEFLFYHSFRKIVIAKGIAPLNYDKYGILTVNIYDFLLTRNVLKRNRTKISYDLKRVPDTAQSLDVRNKQKRICIMRFHLPVYRNIVFLCYCSVASLRILWEIQKLFVAHGDLHLDFISSADLNAAEQLT